MRRFESDFDGVVDLIFDLRKLNTVNDRGGGITGRIFLDGVEIYTQFVANDDGIGFQGSLNVDLDIG